MANHSDKKRPGFNAKVSYPAGSASMTSTTLSSSSASEHPNYIRQAFLKSSRGVKLASGQLQRLSGKQRLALSFAVFFLFFWPLFGLLLLTPWILAGSVLAYSVVFGVSTFVQDLEETLVTEASLSEKNVNLVKTVSKNLQSNWIDTVKFVFENGKVYAVRGFGFGKERGMTLFTKLSELAQNLTSKARNYNAAPKSDTILKTAGQSTKKSEEAEDSAKELVEEAFAEDRAEEKYD